MPPPTTQRYNAKARGSKAGESAHKKRKRRPNVQPEDEARSHIQADDEEQDGIDRRGMSSKKRKRLDSYIAKKLKNEERAKTLQLLASLAPATSTSAALLSSSSLGQNPTAPTSAKERSDKREDRLVRRGIERISKRTGKLGGSSDSEATDGQSRSRRPGDTVEVVEDGKMDIEERIKTSTVPTKAERKAQAKTAQETPRQKMPRGKKANWNPQLLSTQPDSSSSEFDSSESEADIAPEAGPSQSRSASPIASTATPLSEPLIEVSAPSENPIVAGVTLGSALGSALKSGTTLQPRVVVRRKPAWARPRTQTADSESESDSNAQSEEDEDDNGDETLDSEGSDNENEDSENEEEEEETSQDVAVSSNSPLEPKRRALGFKSWAMAQMGQAQSEQPAEHSVEPPPKQLPVKAANIASMPEAFVGPLGAKFTIPSTSLLTSPDGLTLPAASSNARPKIDRRPSVSEARMDLPILAEEQAIVEAILMNPVVIIAGETGSGKTTQVPQMLYEAGFGFKTGENPGMIAITQPRRVAAVSLAARVKSELNLPPRSSTVAHQIRYSSTTSPETAIKFMTDGVLLRELAGDFLLSRYSVIVVDEAHERGVNTDVLIGVLSRVAKLREKVWREGEDTSIKPLRIVIMSATLRIDDFASNERLFPTPPPVIHISARQHPVTIHFNRRTVGDYVTEAYKKVCKIHSRLPPGGILVFMTGQGEIQMLCRKLEKKYAKRSGNANGGGIEPKPQSIKPTQDAEIEAEDVDLGGQDDLAADIDDGDADSDPEALDTEDETDIAGLDVDEPSDMPMHILPLYSLLPNEQQMKVFQPAPLGTRMVIVATNVAETSLTIPGIRYVVDSGRSKERQYDPISGVQTFQVSWISKASGSQRAGRAGRTGPGHCYRLYSSALFEDHFAKFAQPEIMRMPIEGVVLQMKSMNIDNVINFPFPTPPDRHALKKAEDLLTSLGALAPPVMGRLVNGVQQQGSVGGSITDLGRSMAGYPVSPRFAKMLAIGGQHGCLPYIVAIVAGLSVGDPFVHENMLGWEQDDGDAEEDEEAGAEVAHIKSEELRAKEERKTLRGRYWRAQTAFMGLGNGQSDTFKLLAAIGAYEYDPTPAFCAKHFLRPKAMQEIQQLRSQISNLLVPPLSVARLQPPSDTQLKVIRQILLSSFMDNIAVRQDISLKQNRSFTSCRNVPYKAMGVQGEVFVHPSSALFHKPPPEWIVYGEIVRSQASEKVAVRGVTRINAAWIATLAPASCSWSKPEEVRGKIVGRGASGNPNERDVVVVPHLRGLGVDLPPVKKTQKREGTRWVLVE